MARRYDVDFGNKRLTLADAQLPIQGEPVVNIHKGGPLPSVPDLLAEAPHVWVQCGDIEAAWSSLNRHTQDVLAAGGLLTNAEGALLCIHRLGHWDLPKGKVEPGEDWPTAAAREVHEECGVPLPVVGAPFATTYHVYGKSHDKMKVTHWFRMTPAAGTEAVALTPQTEEGITEVRWALPEEVAQLEAGAFGNISRLMRAWRANP